MQCSNCWSAEIKVYDSAGFCCTLADLPSSEQKRILREIKKGHGFGILEVPPEWWYGTEAPEGMNKQDHIEKIEETERMLSTPHMPIHSLDNDHLELNIDDFIPEPDPDDEEDSDDEEDNN